MATLWALWEARNNIVLRDIKTQPPDVLTQINVLLEEWRRLKCMQMNHLSFQSPLKDSGYQIPPGFLSATLSLNSLSQISEKIILVDSACNKTIMRAEIDWSIINSSDNSVTYSRDFAG